MDPFIPGLLDRIAPPRKVALFRASRLGDFICATPAFRALRQRLPDAEFTLVGLPFVEPLAARLSSLNRFFAFPGSPGIAEQLFETRKLRAFLERMRAEEFDLVIQMHGSGVCANPITLEFGGRITAGYVRHGDSPGRLEAAFPYPAGEHEVKKVLALTRFLGAPSADKRLDFPLLAADQQSAAQLLDRARSPLIGVHARAEAKTKRWSPERFAVAASRLALSCEGSVVLVGSGSSEGHDELIRRLDAPFLDLCGRTSLGSLGALLSRLSVLLTNDSGPAHIAYALGVPSVTVFGSTLPSEWASTSVARHAAVVHPIGCRPCDFDICPIGYQCLAQVSTDQVVLAAQKVMNVHGKSGPIQANAGSI
ncbi:MAG: glycosyltransferase family 9 protein [Acidobacteria bacterium]|nr:MAG: glycosyltransferase family 9 protein [Acidobacteriota bacterium]